VQRYDEAEEMKLSVRPISSDNPSDGAAAPQWSVLAAEARPSPPNFAHVRYRRAGEPSSAFQAGFRVSSGNSAANDFLPRPAVWHMLQSMSE